MTSAVSDRPLPQVTVRQATLADAETLVALLAEMDDEPTRATLDAEGARQIMARMAAYPYFGLSWYLPME